ncbi:hypothetical protein BST81_19410 [Leptolyngbya sp. 'hensonii']|uniref:FHA domain-containing protein n=1 Tax=Leptolyngbya sp. 'hensonii' TaxID=1922337 RepID=UPI00094FBC71|nr:FHA domain-containing protein [Leptolyngbya sp. 'hensonii']OLP16863.1 hypothetical protein BST81_19410 [Leptolyngbya sp. 'hensonii']
MNPQPDAVSNYRGIASDSPLSEDNPPAAQWRELEPSTPASPDLEADSPSELTGYASTVEIDVSAEDLSALDPQARSSVQLNYIQGVVQGQHAYLITNLLDGESQTLLQPQMVWTMGRNRQVALPLPDKGLSRRHAAIQYVRRQGFYLIDLDSMNGCYINSIRIKRAHPLSDGDQIQLGHTTFTFFISRRYKNLDPIPTDELTQLQGFG